ncbi:MAG: Stp1/IreP family PP2C-type Ser/Thr phosphatase [Chloroflexi bacterium]|nr:MAG: Stp1/IreP family PP2C-type Ser/Thr phosphatase [Chloroflexota bacterium]RLC90288.1 MAG: Stp1/IreP family PP2C-type Ser/Thr phosphatase [Chloroflexota bacterium]HEY67442.1 Stp1/IreP family PP2C-type Ser/Thr phosphatase [Thermoflexia bacterium]
MQLIRSLLGVRKTSTSPNPPSPPVAATARPRLKVGWATDVGEVRRHNEDAALIITATHDGDDALPPFGLFVLADGMGGHQAGEVASSLAARIVAHRIMHQFYLPTLVSNERGTEQPALKEMLVDAVRAANRAVADQVPGGGTTLTCALVLGPRAYVAHVGDSRAYIVTEGKLDQITHDHSLVDRLVELGQLTREEAAIHPQKNVLYRAVGQKGVLEVDTYIRTIPQGGRLLLCSDGLWSMVSEAEMIHIVTTSYSLQAACEGLVTAANQAGGRDNITAILVEPSPN